ncbi:conserved hypothetical protein [Methanocella paludicola SANAE]|uniref:B box-type domain-containing protein n=1 Tax=Methanocella paludicola (strain DSM 17711 / JCM 13418 / NBRC 101707 / SANAE) TaxID=304371 RepID=D1YYB3_METPS|nr:hypothetical protein [Methanocella paludicola]BAI61435.1 conserved hypothetical protein [Methanocella paludicola SANAE]
MKCYMHPEVEATGTCTSCGRPVCPDCSMNVAGKITCKACAEALATQCATAPKKEPWLALALSLFGGFVSGLFIGLGQLYNGQVKKAVILSLAHVFGWFVIIVGYVLLAIVTLGIGAIVCLPMFLIPLLLWLYAMYDAYVTAEKINKGETVKDWLE